MMTMSDTAPALRRAALSALARPVAAFARDRRFAADTMPDDRPDPLAEAYALGHADGLAAGWAAARAEAEAAEAARERITSALAAMDQAQQAALAERLEATVLALCGAMLADAASGADSLARRAAAAAAMFARSGETRVIRLHPEDLALVHARLPEAWHCEPDPALERGALRIETRDGGVEDGPAQWQAALAEAIRQC